MPKTMNQEAEIECLFPVLQVKGRKINNLDTSPFCE
jgi:hypothetical protein